MKSHSFAALNLAALVMLAGASKGFSATSVDEKAAAVTQAMSDDEKVAQLNQAAPALERLGIHGYNYVSEALHGSMSPDVSTVFPQAIGLAATWNLDLVHSVASAVSDETRGHYAAALGAKGWTDRYEGLNVFAPNINIFRDPRWGRGQETYGEDPYLTSRMGIAYITGLQGDDLEHLKLVATAKHFAVHSGPENDRYSFNSEVSQHDLWDTYFPAFEAAVKEAHVQSVMCSYNAINGTPACANSWLLDEVLRKQWGFNGYVVSDDMAVPMLYWNHHTAGGFVDAAVSALHSGVDLPNNDSFPVGHFANGALRWALFRHQLDISDLTQAVQRIFATRYRLGMFEKNGLWDLGAFEIDSPHHRALARQAAQESIVLLKNTDHLLPLTPTTEISVVGRTNETENLLGDYSGHASSVVTPLQALEERKAQIVDGANTVLVFAGLTPNEEGERQDRTSIELGETDVELLKGFRAQGKNIILILTGGSAIAFDPQLADAILQVWYPGEEAGHAIADILFGEVNPSGHLPVTFYRSTSDLPDFGNYSMKNRTYRYFNGSPLFPFGYGLSYSNFVFENLNLQETERAASSQADFCGSIDVKNASSRSGLSVVQIYLSVAAPRSEDDPKVALKKFYKVHLEAGENQNVPFCLSSEQLRMVESDGTRQIRAGSYQVLVGEHSPLTGDDPEMQSASFTLQ